jgi:hypothetical protein
MGSVPLVEMAGFKHGSSSAGVSRGADRRLRHGGHRYCAGRFLTSRSKWTRAETGSRKKRATGHIDGVVSLMMAIAAAGTPAPALDMAALIG